MNIGGILLTAQTTKDSIGIIILGIYIGVMIAIAYGLFHQDRTHAIVTALIASGARDRESALTIGQLSIGCKWTLRRFLKSGGNLRRVVLCANENEFPIEEHSKLKKFWYEKFLGIEVPQKIPYDIARFYIPEENRIAAEMRYRGGRGNPIVTFILSAIAIFAVAALLYILIPNVIESYSNAFAEANDNNIFY